MSEELVEKREAATIPTPAPKEVVAQPREQISVRHNKKLEDMTNDELTDLLGGMSQTQLSAETVATFQADLARVHAEMQWGRKDCDFHLQIVGRASGIFKLVEVMASRRSFV